MQKATLALALLLGLCTAAPSFAVAQTTQPAPTTQPIVTPSPTAVETYNAMMTAAKAGDVDAALGLTFPPQHLTPEEQRQVVERIVRGLGEIKGSLDVLDSAESGDVAIVLLKLTTETGEVKTSVDPLLMAKQNGAWRIIIAPGGGPYRQAVRIFRPWAEQRVQPTTRPASTRPAQ